MLRLVRQVRQVNQLRRLSSYPGIPASSFNEPVKDWKIRRNLCDTIWLPNRQRIFPETDNLTQHFDGKKLVKPEHSNHRVQELVQHITNSDETAAYERFESLYHEDHTVLKHLTHGQRSALLRLLNLSHTAVIESWPRVQTLATAIKQSGNHLRAQDYSQIIKAAFHSRHHNKVQTYWHELNTLNIPKTTDLWNSYIMATCSGHPQYWADFASLNFKSSKDTEIEPPITNNTMELFRDMAAEGNQPDARTHELLVLWFARNGDLDGVRTIISTVWGSPTDPETNKRRLARISSTDQPTTATLTNIIHAYAVNKELMEGIRMLEWMSFEYKVRLDDRVSSKLWETVLRWAFLDRRTPRDLFRKMWDVMSIRYKVEPHFYLYYLRLRWLESGNLPNRIVRELTEIRKTARVKNKNDLQRIYLNRAARLYANNGFKDKALRLVETWAKKDPIFEIVQDQVQKRLSTSIRPLRAEQSRKEYHENKAREAEAARIREQEKRNKKTRSRSAKAKARKKLVYSSFLPQYG